MKFHSKYCPECRKKTLFLEKLVDPSADDCSEIEDKCLTCKK